VIEEKAGNEDVGGAKRMLEGGEGEEDPEAKRRRVLEETRDIDADSEEEDEEDSSEDDRWVFEFLLLRLFFAERRYLWPKGSLGFFYFTAFLEGNLDGKQLSVAACCAQVSPRKGLTPLSCSC
jgi:protein CWC15